jgi:AraC family transcriptional regulator, regulatory protein of adaptative response / methylated-DNA-[protein]-cysteine methyltransferase
MQNVLAESAYATDESRWLAVLERDRQADGFFYYAVRTTGVYCRPTCAGRRPLRQNVEFYEEPEAAERAGFRACRRCYPKEVSPQQQMVAEVQRLLETVEPTPSLAELGRRAGFSQFHLQRVFKRATGLSPKQYILARRAERLKSELKRGTNVTNAMQNAGYSSSRSLHESATTELGMSPSTYRNGGRGERVAYCIADSPLGRLLIAATAKGVCTIKLGEDAELVSDLVRQFPRATLVEDERELEDSVRAVVEHLEGHARQLELQLDAHGSAFQHRVWDALREIPYGQTRTYQQVAEMIGTPTAARAVARACATNPVALAIPCHRVVRTGGALSGYRWGVERKRALLEKEQAGR